MTSRDALKALFFAALDCPASDREAFLLASTSDPDLLRDVRALLAAHADAGEFLEQPPESLLPGPSLNPGECLGPYEIVELIGQGSMGEVYRARDTRLNRPVAVKVLPHALGLEPARRRRFEDEARAASTLNHPNVVTVFDVGVFDPADGSAYLVTELLDGDTLRAELSHGRLTTPRTLEIALQIAHGLTAAHAAGIVHRDLKPENLFITRDGRVKILDFGIAKFVRADGHRTRTGAVLGTNGYMAPEQVRAQPVDSRSDVFSFGAVLYEMATGQRAFDAGSGLGTMEAILHYDPIPRGLALGLHPPIDAVVRRCLAKNPADRFPDATALAAALAGPDRRAQGQSHPASGPRGIWLTPVTAALIIGAIAVAVAAGLWMQRPATAPQRGTEPAVASASTVRTLTVLPFVVVSPADSPSLRAIAERMTEDTTARLARLASLRTVRRAAARDGASGASVLLTGKLRADGGRVSLAVELADSTAKLLWSQQYDQPLAGYGQVHSDVARQIATTLALPLSADERNRLTQVETTVPAAYEFYLRSVGAANSQARLAALTEAVTLDPKFAVAWGDLARLRTAATPPGDGNVAEALAAAQRAVSADPNEARAHYALASIHLRQGQAGEARLGFLRALDLSPGFSAAARGLSAASASLGRLDESLARARQALELEPDTVEGYVTIGAPLLMLADPSAADEWLRRGAQQFPRAGQLQAMLAAHDFMTGREQAAVERASKALATEPADRDLQLAVAQFAVLSDAPEAGPRVAALARWRPDARPPLLAGTVRTLQAYYLRRRGDGPQAAALLRDAQAAATARVRGGGSDAAALAEIAAIQALRGERAEALASLQAASAAGLLAYRELRRDPLFAALRDDAEFVRLLQQMETDVATLRARSAVNGPTAASAAPAAR